METIFTPPAGDSEPSKRPGTRRAAARRRRRLTRYVMAAGLTTAFALTLVVMHYASPAKPQALPHKASTRASGPVVPDARSISDSGRQVYRYSIVPGGVRSAQEVAQAMESDPVVMDHYGDLRPSKLHEEEIKELTLVHASYRIGDKVFWTKKKLALKPGERVLTDGTTTIRERCGNLLTMTVEPLAPSLIDEPVPPDFDEVSTYVPQGTSLAFGPPPEMSSTDESADPPGDAARILAEDPLVPVPEPSTWVLVALGLGFGIFRYAAKRA